VHPGYTGAWEAYELVPGGMTVNALYEINTYTVTYENTKDVLHGNPLKYVVTDETVVLADLAKDGYIFEGWYAGDVRVTEIAQGSTGDVVLTAKWTPIVYNIKLHFDPAWGEYVDVTNPLTYTVEDSFELIDLKCLIPGYAFDGWYTEKNSATGEKKSVIVAGSIGDIELYSSFALERYTITYVGVENADNSHNRSYYMIDTATFSISDINRPGYIFAGWYADEARTVPAALNVFKGSMGDITLYAKWITKTYTITYDAMGGSLPDNPTTYDITTSIVLAAPERPGYVFQGWYSDKIGGDMITEIQPGYVGDLTLYARWHAKQFSIQYVLEGGENAAENLTSYNITTKFSFAEPTKRGYKFAGWFTDDAYTEKISGIGSGSVGNLTLYAKWELEEYTITYDVPADVEHENELKKYTVETDATELLAASRNGYVFEGWYLDAKYTKAIAQIPGIGLIGDLTLYARFTPKQYYIWLGSDEDNSHTVTFELNGAGESFTQEVTMINGLAFPEIPVRDGYVFAGWFDNVACEGDLFDFSLPVREDITLWAKWIDTESFIKINAPVEVELNGVIKHEFTFVSLIDTVITVSTSGTLDTCGALYDADGKVLLTSDDAS
ncbi:MAG: InlB B-repeat-containing protein, partial [Clostridia bacterium]|nr:InlB B-repeat-containing protein [Clostridia bacterium]